MSLLLEKLRSICERQEFIAANVPRCICGSEQVQLATALTVPARWRCHVCKMHFRHEPARATPRPLAEEIDALKTPRPVRVPLIRASGKRRKKTARDDNSGHLIGGIDQSGY
jgi:hypothetical protein